MKPGESPKQTEAGEETDVWNGQNGEGPDVRLPPLSFSFNPVALGGGGGSGRNGPFSMIPQL